MRAIEQARHFIAQDPASPAAHTLSKLVRALQAEAAFPISDIYDLDFDCFNLSLEILREWRIDRYYAGKLPLVEVPALVAA